MSGTNYLDNNNQTSLLFKRFQNKVQAGINTGSGSTDYSNETTKALKNVFNSSIFAEDVPLDLPQDYWISSLDICGSIQSTLWDNSGNQTIGSFQIPNTPLTFYKDVFLQPCQGTNNAWYLLSGGLSTDFNVIKNMIPYNYQPVDDSTYTPIVKYWNGSSWQSQGQNNYDPTGLNWLIDYESGVLEFYQTDSVLNTTFNIDYSSPTDSSQNRPRISCICYTGPMGITGSGSGGSGLIKVGDISNDIVGNTLDVSAIYFDTGGFDVSLNPTEKTAIITNKGGSGSGGGGITELSYNFFDIPLAPFDGSGTLNTAVGSGTIELEWTNPYSTQTALPFGTFTSYKSGQTAQSDDVQIRALPFHQHLHIEYMEFDNAGTPVGDLSNNADWTDISINNSGINQHVLPNTLVKFNLNASATSSSVDPSVSLINTNGPPSFAPFDLGLFTGLTLGKGYQFRIYLDNSGINLAQNNGKDKLYGQDVSWNYMYIPDISLQFLNYISLGSYGPAEAPTDVNFGLFSWNSPEDLTLLLSTTNNADASLNTPFPIAPTLSLRYKFGIDISGSISPNSIQDPSSIYFNVVSPNSYPFFITDLSSVFGTENNTSFQFLNLTNDISVCPQFIYDTSGFYGVNNDFSSTLVYSDASASFEVPIPTRSESVISQIYETPLSSNPPLHSPVVNNEQNIAWDFPTNAVTSLSSQATTKHEYNVYFLENNSSFDLSFNDKSTPIKLASNNVVPYLLGTDSSGFLLSYFDLSYSPSTQNDISGTTGETKGYLQNTFIDISNDFFNMDISAVEAGKTPIFQYQGYYTGLDLYDFKVKNIKLDNYQDICNNVINIDEYEPYTLKLLQYYNDNSANISTPNWINTGDSRDYDLYIGKRPDNDINASVPTYNSPSATLNNYLMGLRRPNPSSSIPFDISYTLSDIDPNWVEPDSLNILSGIANDYLNYTASSPSVQCDLEVEPYPNNNLVTINVNPTLEIPSSLFTTQKIYSRGDTNANQFEFIGEHASNVTFGTGPQQLPFTPIAILFGGKTFVTGGKKLWWDYTWGGTGNQPFLLPSSFFSSTPSSSIVFIKAIGYNGWSNDTSYNHTISITDKQLMWANSKFVGVSDSPSTPDYPYIDFSNNFYNPNGELLDYSIYNNIGLSGESFSQTYTSIPAQNNFWNQNQGTSATVNRVLKYITFNIDCPFRDDFQNYNSGTSQDFIYQLTLNSGGIDHDTSVTSSSDGYWVFHNEKNTTGSTFGPFDGQKLWTTSTGTTPGSGSYVQNTGTLNDGYKIAFPSQTSGTKSVLQISIGLPSDLVESISSVNITFKAV